MYRFLDRPLADLAEPDRFLLTAVRLWMLAAQGSGRAAAMLRDAFARAGSEAAAPDFGMAMTTLAHDGPRRLHVGRLGEAAVLEDEAVLLALFAEALAGRADRCARIAAGLVEGDAASRLATAATLMAARWSDGVFVERDR